MDMVFPAERTHFPGIHKIDAPISGPRIADKNFTDTRISLIVRGKHYDSGESMEGCLVYLIKFFPGFSFENKRFVYTKPLIWPVDAPGFSELRTPLVYYFCPSDSCLSAPRSQRYGCECECEF